jgi:hypothetical protein
MSDMFNISNIPDLVEMTNKLIEFIEFSDKPETIKLKENNIGNYNYIISNRFSILPTSMIKLLSDREKRSEHLQKILEMIDLLKSVKSGSKSYESAETEFIEKRSEEYLYPQFGGKDNFYKIAEENKKKQEEEKKQKK